MRDINDILTYSKPLTLLYVEGNRDLRERNEEIFSHYFREVVCTTSASEAIGLYKRRKTVAKDYFDIVITDIEMPHINGIELCRRILAENPDQKLIALSAHNEPSYLFELINMGISSFLLKPITHPALCEVLYTTAKAIYDDRLIRFRTHQVNQLNQKLQGKITELGNTVNAANEATRQKDLFISSFGREMRFPIQEIVERTGRLLQTPLGETQNRSIIQIHESAQQLLEIVNDILDISESESGELHLESIDFNLNDILSQLSERISHKARGKHLDIAFEIERSLPIRYIGDPFRLRQILFNLFTNALKHTQEGSIRLKISIEESEQSVRTVTFEIIDTGSGMSSAQCAKAFDPFAPTSRSKRRGDTGLGLSLSQKLVQRMGGDISVRSSLGKGSTFTVRLPLTLSAPHERRLYRLPSAAIMGKNVLIVDPHPHFARSLAQKLHYFHCDVDLHENCSDIPLKGYHYDIIMVDASLMKSLCGMLPSDMPLTKLVVLGGDAKTAFLPEAKVADALSKPCSQQMIFELLIRLYDANAAEHLAISKVGKDTLLKFKGSRILLAEDNLINQMIVEGMLENTGIELVCVTSGLEALKKLEEMQIDLVLMNLKLPIMGGLQAAQNIRSLPRHDHLPIIALASAFSDKELQSITETGMQSHLQKPLDAGAFYELIGRYLRESFGSSGQVQRA